MSARPATKGLAAARDAALAGLAVLAWTLVSPLIATTAFAQASAPYAPPFQLRPAIAPNVVRIEATLLADAHGVTEVTALTFAHRVARELSLLGRTAYAIDAPHDAAPQGALANTMVGLLYTPVISAEWRLSLFGAVSLPLGQAEGLPGTHPEAAALGHARVARASMDNALFSTNHLTVAVGIGLTWQHARWIVQAELTFLGGLRARGPWGSDGAVENSSGGLWVAYAALDELFVGAGLQGQCFLTTPALVVAHGEMARAQLSASVGVRGRFVLGGGVVAMPGLVYVRGIEGVLAARDANLITVELATLF